MICKVCGRTSANDDANFCEYCGASFREMKQSGQTESSQYKETMVQDSIQQGQMYQQNQPDWQGQSSQQRQYQNQSQGQYQSPYQNQAQGFYQQNMQQSKKDEPISFLNWIGTMLLPYIPFVGWISYLVMLFVWAFGRDSNPTKKNWARAKLIVIAISIVISIVMIAYVTSSIISSGMTFEDYMNSTTYY